LAQNPARAAGFCANVACSRHSTPTLEDGAVTGTWTAPGGVRQIDAPDPEAYADEAADVTRFLHA